MVKTIIENENGTQVQVEVSGGKVIFTHDNGKLEVPEADLRKVLGMVSSPYRFPGINSHPPLHPWTDIIYKYKDGRLTEE